MLTQTVTDTPRGVRVTVQDRQQTLIHRVLYGEPSADEVQKALETFTAYKLDLCSISEVRRHTSRAMHEAMIIWRACGEVCK